MNKDDVFDLIRDAGYGILATVDGQKPKARPMMPYLDENGNLLIATFAHKRLVGQIKVNPNIEMCFIDRKMNIARVSGQAEVKDDQDKKQLLWDNVPMLKQYFPGPDDPNFVVVEIQSDIVEAMTPQLKAPEVVSMK